MTFLFDAPRKVGSVKIISLVKEVPSGKLTIAMGNPPFEDVSPIKKWWFSIAMFLGTFLRM